jgi:hypothetical protein
MTDDESFHRLARLGEMRTDVADVTRHLTDDLVRGPSAFEFEDNERVSHMIGAQEIQVADWRYELVPGLAIRTGPDLQRAPKPIEFQLPSENSSR